jgi:hypothetical protein
MNLLYSSVGLDKSLRRRYDQYETESFLMFDEYMGYNITVSLDTFVSSAI